MYRKRNCIKLFFHSGLYLCKPVSSTSVCNGSFILSLLSANDFRQTLFYSFCVSLENSKQENDNLSSVWCVILHLHENKKKILKSFFFMMRFFNSLFCQRNVRNISQCTFTNKVKNPLDVKGFLSWLIVTFTDNMHKKFSFLRMFHNSCFKRQVRVFSYRNISEGEESSLE